jgi:soluble lytic murein transglycosylase-like protein
MRNKIWNKIYLKEKVSKLNIPAISTFILTLLVAGNLFFKKIPEKESAPVKSDRPMAEFHSANLNEDFYKYFSVITDSPVTYFMLKNKPIKYPNLEVIAKHYQKSGPFISIVERKIEEHKDIFHLDPVVVLGLMNSESGFNPYAVSVAGAAGLMQLIPETAQEMGLKVYEKNLDIYHNLKEARKNMIKTFNSAIKAGRQENYERLTELFTQYNLYAKETDSLSQEYKKTLLENKSLDERLDPEKNIGAGVKYLAILAKINMETSNIANLRNIIAAYNFKGEDAAKKWTLPPLKEPIKLINKVIEAFIEIRPRAMESPKIYVE